VTVLKIQGKPSTAAMQALTPHVQRIYGRSGLRIMAVVELAHTERTEPAADAEKEPSVTMRITQLEVPNPDQEGAVREVQRALYLERTATGTLDEAGELELSKQTLKDAGGIVTHLAIARLSAGINHWRNYCRRVNASQELTVGELRHELDAIAEGLDSVLGRLAADGQD
jgi:hypothetical protein